MSTEFYWSFKNACEIVESPSAEALRLLEVGSKNITIPGLVMGIVHDANEKDVFMMHTSDMNTLYNETRFYSFEDEAGGYVRIKQRMLRDNEWYDRNVGSCSNVAQVIDKIGEEIERFAKLSNVQMPDFGNKAQPA